jgi:hypothetical protein
MMSDYDAFVTKYRRIVANTTSLLRHKRLAIFVVGEVRDKRTHAQLGFHHDTVSAFKDAGCAMHQDGAPPLEHRLGSICARRGGAFGLG